MINLKRVSTFIVLVFCLIGCGQSEQKTNLKVSFGAVTGSANFPGGLYLFAKSDNGQEFIKQVPPGDELNLELLNGSWDFAVVGWDGESSAYSGKSFCDNVKGMQLAGSDFNIALNATAGNCTQFGTTDSHTGQNFAPVRFFSCLDIKPHLEIGENVDAGMDCNGGGDGGGTGPGGDQSFKIALITKEQSGTIGEGLDSACVNGQGGSGDVSLPYGNQNIFIPVKVTAYAEAGCLGSSTVYKFPNGLNGNALDNLGQSAVDPNNSVNVYLHVDICKGGQLTGSPFAASYGGTGDYHLICTANQFVNIGSAGTQNDTFEIGQNIDFDEMTNGSASTFAYVSNQFRGELRGMYKTLSNGDRALFNSIRENPTDRTYSGNILIDNFNLNFAGVSGQSFGIFANEIDNPGTNDLEIGNIHILGNSSITVTGSTSGYLGGFAGKIDHSNPSSNSYIRKVQSLADVTSTNNSITSQYVGGLVGKLIGISGTNGNGVSLELNDVGLISIPYLNNLAAERKVNITGYKNVGGMVGAIYNGDMRGYNTTDTKISSHGYAGGIIGTVLIDNSNSSFSLAAVKSDLEYIPTGDPSHYVGGVVGFVNQTTSNSSGGSFIIAAANTKVHVPATAAKINHFGGIVGKYYSVGKADLKVYNSKSNLNIIADGDYHGGLIGSYYAPTIEPGLQFGNFPVISYSLSQGNLGNSTTSGKYRGGLIGQGSDTDVYRSISNMDVYGETHVGGAIGSATDSVIHESFLQGLVELTGTSSTNTFAGGAIGELYTNANKNNFVFMRSKVRYNINYNNVDFSTCDNAQCGLVVGGLSSNQSSTISFNSIAVGSIDDTGGALTANVCGSKWGIACPGTMWIYPTSIGTQSSENSFACTALGGSEPFIDDSGLCTPAFEKRWRDYGYDNTKPGFEYIAGNQLEPFGIGSVSQWDSLSDDSFLMAKSFHLKGNINFGGGSPNAIGSEMNPFQGSIYPNTYELQNIGFIATPNKTGVIAYMKSGGSIGHFKSALKVNGLDINCGAESNCGFIGRVDNNQTGGGGDAEVYLNITGGDITGAGSNDCTGGVVGNTTTSIRFNNSSFEGAIDVAGYGVGGLIGCVSSSSSGGSFNEKRIDIDESFVDLTKVIGTNYVGGFIGEVQNTSSNDSFISVSESYVVIDKTGSRSGSSLVGINATSGSYASGLIGAIDLSTSELDVDEVYIDTSTAKLPVFYRPIARKTAGSIDGSDSFRDIGLIWNVNSTSSAGSFYNAASSVPYGSGIEYDVNSVSELLQAGSASGNSFEASDGDDHGDWYYPSGSRVLQLKWENPNYKGDW